MIIPSIDIIDGQAVQLIGGREQALEAGDPLVLAKRFSVVGEIAVIDLDAAMGRGSNAKIIREIVKIAACRVGGGIRDVETAIDWLNAGAKKIILGTNAVPEVLRELPKERVIAAVDARYDEVVVEGWQKRTGETITERIARLDRFVGGFLVTFVELEGRMTGVDVGRVAELVEFVGDAKLTIAGGISSVEQIRQLDQLGADSQVGMAIYTGKLDLADAFAAPLQSDRPDQLWPTVVTDEHRVALGLCYSSEASLREAIHSRQGVYQSRSRGLWKKGELSGATQELLRVEADCDRDALRFVVRQKEPGFCHLRTSSCWGDDNGFKRLVKRLAERKTTLPEESYTARLLQDPELLRAKLIEEAAELADASNRRDVVWEAADLLYFLFVALSRANVELSQVEQELDVRADHVSERKSRQGKLRNYQLA